MFCNTHAAYSRWRLTTLASSSLSSTQLRSRSRRSVSVRQCVAAANEIGGGESAEKMRVQLVRDVAVEGHDLGGLTGARARLFRHLGAPCTEVGEEIRSRVPCRVAMRVEGRGAIVSSGYFGCPVCGNNR